jgi:signal transduction histidine kinase
VARLRAWLVRHALTADVLLTVALVAVIGGLWGHKAAPHVVALAIVVEAAALAPLMVRRRFPLPVFGWLFAIGLTQLWLGRAVLADAAVLIALYTVAAHCPRRQALICAGLVEVGAAGAALHLANRDLESVLAALVFLTGLVTAAFVLGVNMRTRRAYLASLEDRAVRAERERDQQSQLAAAAERTRIAREMHDIVAHNLSVMIALADGAAFAAQRDPDAAAAAAKQVSDTGRVALTEMQRLVGVLRGGEQTGQAGPFTPQPGIDQIEELVTQVRGAGLPTTLTVSGLPFAVPPTAQLAVYRVVQESLTNILKHAKDPTGARVILNYAEPTIILRVTDDGGGAPEARSGGHGLTGMRERAAVFGGWVQAGPRPVGGWQVRALLTCGRAAS